MKRIWKYNIIFAGIAVLLGSCAEEDRMLQPSQESAPEPTSYIRIASGQVGYSTRGVTDEPIYAGQCNADRLIVYQYEYHKYGGTTVNNADPGEVKFAGKYETNVDHFSDPKGNPYYQSDKWARQAANLPFTTTNTSAFAFPAIAYSDIDKDKFTVSYEGAYNQMSLKLSGHITPEFYFGRVGVTDVSLPENKTLELDETSGIYRAYLTSSTNRTKDLTGTLYRVVSQINVVISNVNPDLVERMTMELSNVPTEIGLYADHRTRLGQSGSDQGYHYPVVAAKSNQQINGTTVVCETTDFRNGIAKLSTFLLPSETGRSLNIHIYFKEDIFESEDEEGNVKTFREKSYEIRPPKSYYIPTEVADAYFSAVPLCVYNVTDNLFFSYSNVRVNITGDFDNFFPERTDVEMDVEICSRYDNEHNYDGGLIDY